MSRNCSISYTPMPCWTSNDITRHEILRLLAYRREDFNCSVLPYAYEGNPTGVRRIMDLSGHYWRHSALGDLQALPVEILNATLHFSDLRTFSKLCQVNRQARILVEAFFPYKVILTHAPHVIDIFIQTGAASHFTAARVFDVMCSSSCAICGRFGGFLWIPDCIRCCMPCLRKAPELLLMTVQDAMASFGLSREIITNIPTVDTLPGRYNHLPYKEKRRLLSEARARQAAVMEYGGEEELVACIKTSQWKAAYHKCVASLRGTFHNKTRLNSYSRRFQVTTCLPYFDLASHTTHNGISCKGCQDAADLKNHLKWTESFSVLRDRREQTFTEDMFLEHFKNCTNAQRMWAEHQRPYRTGLC